MEEKKNTEQAKKEKPVEKKPNLIKGFFTGSLLTSKYIQSQRWYILMVFCLAVFYISYRYNIEQTMRRSRNLEVEVKMLNAEYVTKSAELMRLSKRSEVLKLVRQKDLKLTESQTPPKRVKAN